MSIATFAANPTAITLKDPVGLYIHSIDLSGFTKPDGTAVPKRWFKITRGTAAFAVRATFAVPEGETTAGRPLVVGDLTVGGLPLEFGGQLAAAITMLLTGVAGGKGKIPVGPQRCVR